MANELFPVALIPEFDSMLPETFHTLRTPKDAAVISTISKWAFPKVRGASLSFIATAAQEEDFKLQLRRIKGGGGLVDFIVPWENFLKHAYVGVGDGTTTVFDAPVVGTGGGFSTGIANVYVDGVAVSVPGNYSPSSGTGDNGRDRITFVIAPTAGAVITASCAGQQFIIAVMGDDYRPQEIGADLFRITVTLDEV